MLGSYTTKFFNILSIIALYTAFNIHLVSSTAIDLNTRNVSLASSAGVQCTDNRTWWASELHYVDCIGAVDLLYKRDVVYWKDQDFEFISAKVRGRSLTWQRTPRKYTVGTCTVAIVMLNFFKDGELPGIDGELFASRDVSSYLEIWHSAQQLENICLLNGGKQGWTSQGGRGAIGIFLWGTESTENRRVPQGEPVLEITNSSAGSIPNFRDRNSTVSIAVS